MTSVAVEESDVRTPRGLRSVLVVVVAVLVLVSAGLVAAVPGRVSAASPTGTFPVRTTTPDYMKYIQVNSYKFDPLAAMPQIPAGLRYSSAIAGDAYFIVQFGGPVTPSMKASLSATGTVLLYYINYNAFIVRADRTAMDRAASLSGVRWTGIVEPAYKLSPRLSPAYEAKIEAALQSQIGRGTPPPWVAGADDTAPAAASGSTASVSVAILTYESANVLPAAEVVTSIGGLSVQYSFSGGGMLRAGVPRASLPSLALNPGIMWIDLETQPILYNDIARWVIQSGDADTFATPVHDHGITGTGQTVTLGDSGLDYQHPAFADPNHSSPGPDHRKVTDYYIPPGATGDMQDNGINHGTHTSGTIAGDAGTWHVYDGDPTGSNGTTGPHDGQAFDAKIQMQDITNTDPYVFPPSDMHNMFQPAVDRGSYVHSNSWGSVFGDYIAEAQQMDDFIWNNQDFIVTFAAGNPGSYPGDVNPFSVAKNVIAVGASENGAGRENVASFSGRGPATDGRLKPDVMAPGVDVWSARGCDPNPPCNDYWQLSGTSMATPTAAGAATLIRQYYMDGWYPTGMKNPSDGFTPSAALVKATLINSAVEMTGAGAYDNNQNFYPNDNQGWGRILLDNALYFGGDARSTLLEDNRLGVNTGDTLSYLLPIADASMPIEITLVWTDYPGTPMTSPNLVNDLDLVVTAPDGTMYRGNVFAGRNPGQSVPNPAANTTDHLNNVEGVLVISNAQVGVWSVDVTGFDVPQGPQPFAVIMTGGVASNFGVVGLDHPAYQSSATVNVRVVDTGLNADPKKIDSTWVWMSSTTETVPENLTLIETDVDSGVFAGSIALDNSASPIADGLLQVQDGDTIIASYFDANDGMGGSGWRTATAVVDDTPPVISDVAVLNLRFNRGTIAWTTDELSNSTVVYGVGTPPDMVVASPARVTTHALKLAGLTEQTTYYFEVRSADAAGNMRVDDNGTNFYTFTTPVMPPTPAADQEWPTFHNNNARLGASPSDMTPPLTEEWTAGPYGRSYYNGPVLKDGLLFMTSTDGHIRALDPFTGTVLWSQPLGSSQGVEGIPVVDGGVVYTTFVSQGYGTVYALDEATGDILWSNGPAVGGPDFFEITAMAHADGYVFGYTYAGSIYALYDTNGTVAWLYPASSYAMLGVTVAAGLVFGTTMDGRILALDETTGTFVWSQGLDIYAVAPPTYLHGNLYLATYGGTIYGLDAFTGEIVWQRGGFGGPFFIQSPATDGSALFLGMIVYTNNTGAVLALDAMTGDVLWTSYMYGGVTTPVAYANGFVYAASSDGFFRAIRASDGTVVDTKFLSSEGSASTPAVSGGWVWIDDLNGELHAFLGQTPVGVLVEPAVQSRSAVPSSVVHYALSVKNVGTSGADTFDAQVTLGSLGWPVGIYHSDGVTPLGDTDSDGVPDTGPLAPGAGIPLDIQVSVPADANLGDSELSLVAFTSSNNVSRYQTVRLTTLVPFPGVSVGPRGYLPGTPGTTVSFAMTVDNLGGAADTVELTASSRQGWTVGLYRADGTTLLTDTDSDGKVDTGILQGLASVGIVLKVQIPSSASQDTVDVVSVVGISHAVPQATASSALIVELAPPVEGEWPQFHHDRERSGVAPVPYRLPLTEAWSASVGGESLDRSAVVIHDHTVFVAGTMGAVTAVDLGTGTLLWRTPLGVGNSLTGGPAVAYGNVYVVLVTQLPGNISYDITLFALDAPTGHLLWRSNAPGTYYGFYSAPTTPAVAAGIVYWSTYTGYQIIASDAVDGHTIWTHNMAGLPMQGPTYWGGMVYATDTMGTIVALDATSGAEVWSSNPGVGIDSAPTVVGGVAYVGDYNGDVFALDATTGTILWSHYGGYPITSSSVAVAEGLVLVAAGGSYSSSAMYALDARTGDLVWVSPQSYVGFSSSPAVNNGTVFAASTVGYLLAWNVHTGVVVQEYSLAASITSSMALADGYLVVADTAGWLHAFAFKGAGEFHGIRLTPERAEVPVGSPVVLTATGVDVYDNTIPGLSFGWRSSEGLGTILTLSGTSQVAYIAGTTAGRDVVVASHGSYVASAIIDVLPGDADHIDITPAAAEVPAGGTLSFAGIVADEYENARSDGPVTWSASAEAGTINASGVLVASTSLGTGTVTAAFGSLSAVVPVTVVPGPAASLLAAPSSASVTAGGTVVLTATPMDAYGNPTGGTVTWTATAGTVTPLVANGTSALYLAPTSAGTQTVTASSAGKSVDVRVEVTGAPTVGVEWQTYFLIAVVAAVILAAVAGFLFWRSRRAASSKPPESKPPEGPAGPGGPPT